MRDALIAADGLTEGEALTSIGSSQLDRLSRQTRQCAGRQQLPFLDRLRKRATTGRIVGQQLARRAGQAQLGHRRRGEVGLGLSFARRKRDQHDLPAVAGNDGFGDGASGDPLHGFLGNVSERKTDDALAGDHSVEQFGGIGCARCGEEPSRPPGLGHRTRGQCPTDLLHQDGRVQQAEPETAGRFGHAQRKRTQLRQARPQRRIEPRRQCGAHARHAAVLIEEAREGVAHHLLIFGNVEIHDSPKYRRVALPAAAIIVSLRLAHPRDKPGLPGRES